MFNYAKRFVKPEWALIVGLAITYVSGFLAPLFPDRTVDVLQWGSPFPYLYRVVAFQAPPSVDWRIAVLDCLIWTVVAAVILSFLWPNVAKGEKSDAKK
jgi:hypothetical protein